MPDPRPANVDPKPDLADIPVHEPPAAPDDRKPSADDPPAKDLTLPTE